MLDLWGGVVELEPAVKATVIAFEAAAERRRKLASEAGKRRTAMGNPLITLYGPGPTGAHCGTCEHCFYHQQSRRWYKCALRENTRGAATDIRVRWDACGKYEPREATQGTTPDEAIKRDVAPKIDAA